MQKIYLDNNATTPLDMEVFQAMLGDLCQVPLNPSSIHSSGRQANQLLSGARRSVATVFGAKPDEIYFTSGGTEAINLFLKSLEKGHLITTAIEHSSVYKTSQVLEAKGFTASYIPVDRSGAPHPEAIAAAIRPDTRALLFSASNAETGVKLDLEAVALVAEKHQIPLLVDAVAYVGKESFSMLPGVTAVAISGHKFHAPKGIGALFCRSSFQLEPLITGGGQEHLKRAGTENLSGILGLAAALEIVQKNQGAITHQIRALRDHFEQELFRALPNISINGLGPRVCNVSNIAFGDVDGETLLLQLDLFGIAASHGSACSARAMEPSRVLLGMGLDRKTARSSLRFSFSRMNTQEEVELAVTRLVDIVQKLRLM